MSGIGMPGEDGYSLIKKVRLLPTERGGRTPAAVFTTYAGDEDCKRALAAGFQMHMPNQLTQLIAMIARLARRPA